MIKNTIDDLREQHQKSLEIEKQHEDLVRKNDQKNNEGCFLPNKEKIEYNSILIFELFNHEKFDDLKNGLNKLYQNSQENLNIEEFFNRNMLSFKGWKKLPTISNHNFDGFFTSSIELDLGQHIHFITVYLHRVLPSMIMLKIRAYFNDNASEELNEIIYKHHETEIIYHDFPDEIPNQRFLSLTTSSHSPPDIVKTREITNYRLHRKKEVLNFISKYFKGFFLNSGSNEIDIIPHIEIYSVNFPKNDKDITKWANKCHGFLKCFHTFFYPNDCYKLTNKDNSYLFLVEHREQFANYFIFMNGDDSNDAIQYISFESVAFNRWLQIQEREIAKFGEILADEIDNLEKNKLDDILKNRKMISKKIFYFELFKTELKLLEHDDNGFKLLDNEKEDLNNSWMTGISQRINDIDGIIYTFNKHLNIVLGLKNIEYSKKMDCRVYWLTIIVIILAIVQILTNPNIFNLFYSFLSNVSNFFIQLFLVYLLVQPS